MYVMGGWPANSRWRSLDGTVGFMVGWIMALGDWYARLCWKSCIGVNSCWGKSCVCLASPATESMALMLIVRLVCICEGFLALVATRLFDRLGTKAAGKFDWLLDGVGLPLCVLSEAVS